MKLLLIIISTLTINALGNGYTAISELDGVKYETTILEKDLVGVNKVNVKDKLPITLPQAVSLSEKALLKNFKGSRLFLHRVSVQRMGENQPWFYKVTYKSKSMRNGLEYIVLMNGRLIEPKTLGKDFKIPKGPNPFEE